METVKRITTNGKWKSVTFDRAKKFMGYEWHPEGFKRQEALVPKSNYLIKNNSDSDIFVAFRDKDKENEENTIKILAKASEKVTITAREVGKEDAPKNTIYIKGEDKGEVEIQALDLI